MDRKNLLIVGGLAGIILFLVIGIFIIIPSVTDTSTGSSNSITGDTIDPANDPSDYLTFDNSTPEATAISIARLNEGLSGFYNEGPATASLTSDGKYWIVNLEGTIVTVDAKTWISKTNEYTIPPRTWTSLDELKAYYIAQIQTGGETTGEYSKVTMDGKEIWKIAIYEDILDNAEIDNGEPLGYVYIDLATGKSKKVYNNIFDELLYIVSYRVTGDGWLTLKEVDERSGWWPQPFKNALRNLYPE